jgi:carboxypeptidase C (cathepsin A)
VNAFNNMKWTGSDEYRKAEREGFFLDGKLVGYVKKVRNFVDAMILNAGHMVPTDQPAAMLSLLDKFICNKL